MLLEKEFLKFKKRIAKKNKRFLINNYLRPYYEQLTQSCIQGWALAHMAYYKAKLENRLDEMNYLKRGTEVA